MADKERVDVSTLDELSRRDLIKRAGAGVILVYGGLGAHGKAYGAPKYRHKELQGTLRILQWSHFVPAFDRWFDNVYTKAWGRANDTEVIVDHVNQADLPGRVAAEAAAGSSPGSCGSCNGATSCPRTTGGSTTTTSRLGGGRTTPR